MGSKRPMGSILDRFGWGFGSVWDGFWRILADSWVFWAILGYGKRAASVLEVDISPLRAQ